MHWAILLAGLGLALIGSAADRLWERHKSVPVYHIPVRFHAN